MVDNIREKVLDILSQKLKIDKSIITDNSYFTSDLGINSFSVLALVCDLEDEFDCNIPDEKLKDLQKVGDLIHFLSQLKQ